MADLIYHQRDKESAEHRATPIASETSGMENADVIRPASAETSQPHTAARGWQGAAPSSAGAAEDSGGPSTTFQAAQPETETVPQTFSAGNRP